MERYLTIEQAADQLGMSPRYVRRLITDRKIAFHRMGRSVRIAERDLEAHASAGRVEPMTASSVWREMRRVTV